MLDYNSTSRAADAINAAIDAALQTANAAMAPRDYLGGSRLGHACERALQFEFTHAPKDDGAEFGGKLHLGVAGGLAQVGEAAAEVAGACFGLGHGVLGTVERVPKSVSGDLHGACPVA